MSFWEIIRHSWTPAEICRLTWAADAVEQGVIPIIAVFPEPVNRTRLSWPLT